ncbi:hypothetical protein ACS0Y7_32940 [Burkholderia gladioli]|uniref:hypothetical protein n=1 Tax=Burkholderia gladioli TaxID=28095 RepID=UPI003F7A99CC
MLSPHEFATLMLVRQAPDQLDLNRQELDALLERRLIMLEHCAAGGRRVHLTGKGRSFLAAFDPLDPLATPSPTRSRGKPCVGEPSGGVSPPSPLAEGAVS